MNIIELAKQAGINSPDGFKLTINHMATFRLEKFAELVAAQERDAIMKSIEELRPVEDNPLLQNKPAAFWVENFRQIVYARSKV